MKGTRNAIQAFYAREAQARYALTEMQALHAMTILIAIMNAHLIHAAMSAHHGQKAAICAVITNAKEDLIHGTLMRIIQAAQRIAAALTARLHMTIPAGRNAVRVFYVQGRLKTLNSVHQRALLLLAAAEEQLHVILTATAHLVTVYHALAHATELAPHPDAMEQIWIVRVMAAYLIAQ